jgi:ankyrin repeat protein
MAAMQAIEAIHRAARRGGMDRIAGLLDEDPGLLSSVWKGDTLLTTAAWNDNSSLLNDNVDLVRLLLERGAEINQADVLGDTALDVAAAGGHEEIVSALLTSGADVSRKGYQGQTALMCATMGGHVAVVRLVLQSMGGGGLDERDRDGCTALWYACLYGHADVLRNLLLAGADHTIAGNDDTTPLQIAEEEEHHECVALFQVSTSSCRVQ